MKAASLKNFLIEEIKSAGAMDIGTFMSHALCHPQYGYYMVRDPFGRGGDFITAPEISQMFGELIGAWAADIWLQMGSPDRFLLVECGAGRGTLMSDALRAVKAVKGFHDAMSLHLIEASPLLKSKQEQNLQGYNAHWHYSLADLYSNSGVDIGNIPMILIGNEFIDALPVRQILKKGDSWLERVVNYDLERGFYFDYRPLQDDLYDYIRDISSKGMISNCGDGDIFEVSPPRDNFVKDVCRGLRGGGAALFIDYGYKKSAAGDSLQAVMNHQYCEVLDNIGMADITAHVDFERIADIAGRCGARSYGTVSQAQFLGSLGIAQRSQMLINRALEKYEAGARAEAGVGVGARGNLSRGSDNSNDSNDSNNKNIDENEQKYIKTVEDIRAAIFRLCGSSEAGSTAMGRLFKAICISYDEKLYPAGF